VPDPEYEDYALQIQSNATDRPCLLSLVVNTAQSLPITPMWAPGGAPVVQSVSVPAAREEGAAIRAVFWDQDCAKGQQHAMTEFRGVSTL
jgi:hypothetical protein